MEVIYLNQKQLHIKNPVCVALGFFDGLHRGHMALVDKVIEIAETKGYQKALMTFDHYPLYVLGKVEEELYLTSMEDRIKILEEKSLDYLFIIEFNKDVAAFSPQAFIEKYLLACHVQHVVCGFDYRFGFRNQGNVETLKACSLFDVSVIDEVLYRNEKISSSRIRQILEEGYIDEMNDLLGRHYCLKGEIIKGRQIGHTIGFPTANVDYQSYFLPKNGVYVVKVYLGNESYIGMCNIGYNPTFTALKKKSLEVYILDFDRDIYGETMSVEFYQMLRPEQSFSSKEELVQQLNEDKEKVRLYFQEK